MVVHIDRSILLSEQSTLSFCPRLLACLVVSCTGPHQRARLPPLEGGTDPTLFMKGCVNRFKALLQNVSPLFHSIFVLWNMASCLITPPNMPTNTTLLLYQSISHPPTISRQEIFDPCHLYSTHSFQRPSCSPEIGQLFLILGVHSRGECLVPVSCSKLTQEGDDNRADGVQSLLSGFPRIRLHCQWKSLLKHSVNLLNKN